MSIEELSEEAREKSPLETFDIIMDKINEIIEKLNKDD
tara:strand:+ start:1938 stop:2051 length:114 start_codon:yes stop_codon:yes gene_type:complete